MFQRCVCVRARVAYRVCACISRLVASTTDWTRFVRDRAQDKDIIGGEAGKTFTTTSHVKVSAWAADIDARRANPQ